MKVESSLDGSSDHTPVICTVSTTVILREPRQTLYNHKTDWDSFRDYINENANLQIPLKTEEDIDNTAYYVTDLIQQAAWLSTPYIECLPQSRDYTLEIKKMVAQKRKLRRKWQTYRNPQDKEALNKAKKELKHMLRDNENQTIQEKIKMLSPYKSEEYSLWKITKYMKRPTEHMPPLKGLDGTWLRKPEEKAELFAQFLKEVLNPMNQNQQNPMKK